MFFYRVWAWFYLRFQNKIDVQRNADMQRKADDAVLEYKNRLMSIIQEIIEDSSNPKDEYNKGYKDAMEWVLEMIKQRDLN